MKPSFYSDVRIARSLALAAVALATWLPSGDLIADDGISMKPAKVVKTESKVATGDEFSFDNSVVFSGMGTIVNGNKGEFMQRHGMDKGFSGGIENFHWQEKLDKDTTFTVDGRGLFDANDYKLDMQLVRPDVGYIKVGYNQFRTWYDGSGGFLPQNGQWFSPKDQVLALDRGTAWFETALTLPDLPVLTFRYEHEFRDGKKDSTVWGDSTTTGGLGIKKIAPAFRNFDEKRDTFTGTLQHTLDKTKVDVG
ncbi:MAG: hypothetical protein ACOYMV_09830, partial [Verrucomicrobiia bacterium]